MKHLDHATYHYRIQLPWVVNFTASLPFKIPSGVSVSKGLQLKVANNG